MFKKIALALLILFVIAAIVAAILLRPYYEMPPEPVEILDAKLAEYEKIAEAVKARPKADREAIDAMLAEYGEVLKEGLKEIQPGDCPHYDAAKLVGKSKSYELTRAAHERLAAINDGGLIYQFSMDWKDDILNFSELRAVFYWEQALAVLEVESADTTAAAGRLATLYQTIDGVEQAPLLIMTMIGVALERMAAKTVVHLAPKMQIEDLKRVQAKLKSLPDLRSMVIQAFKAEAYSVIASFNKPDQLNEFLKLLTTDPNSVSPIVVRMIATTSYIKRERYMYTSIAAQDIENYEKWLAEGGETVPISVVGDRIVYCPVGAMAMPNTKQLAEKTREAMVSRRTLISAIDAEIQRRETEPKPEIEIPYGDDKKIVLKDEYGCIVENKK
jgi:hypothetical protein